MLVSSKSKRLTTSCHSSGIPTRILTTKKNQKKFSKKFHTPTVSSAMKTKGKSTICMAGPISSKAEVVAPSKVGAAASPVLTSRSSKAST